MLAQTSESPNTFRRFAFAAVALVLLRIALLLSREDPAGLALPPTTSSSSSSSSSSSLSTPSSLSSFDFDYSDRASLCEKLHASASSRGSSASDYFAPTFSSDGDKRRWRGASCTHYFYVKRRGEPSSLRGSVDDSIPGPKVSDPRDASAPAVPSSPSPVSPPAPASPPPSLPPRSNPPLDPMWGKHWSPSPVYDSVKSRRDKAETPASPTIPASVTTVWDLQSDLPAPPPCVPGGAEKCCPARDPQEVWGVGRNPVVAVCASATSRKVPDDSLRLSNLALFSRLLPSLPRTFDCDVDYLLTLAYDKGDRFYDDPETQSQYRRWLLDDVAAPMHKAGARLTVLLVRVDNNLAKPGPAFNAMLREAHRAGADYMYRLNDDSELAPASGGGAGVGWTKAFMAAINRFGPPYGVVGPTGGLPHIITHDFVHRTHMEIFEETYYPPVFVDWFLDDWISHVYGETRSIKASQFEVIHHTNHHGQRYVANRQNENLLPGEHAKGVKRILEYCKDKKIDVFQFEEDEKRYSKAHRLRDLSEEDVKGAEAFLHTGWT